MSKRSKGARQRLASALEESVADPRVRAAAASAVAGGALATGAAVRDRLAARRLRERARYRLQAKDSPLEGIGRVARGQLDLAVGSLEDADGKRRVAGIHEARKSLKRLRTLVRLSRDLLGPELYRHEATLFRDAGRSLSEARDAQVLLQTLDALVRAYPQELGPVAAAVREALSAAGSGEADEDPAALVGTLSDARVRVASWPLPESGGLGSLADGFERLYRRGRRAERAAREEPTTENLHELRKRAKDLWYAAQLLRDAQPKRMKKLARRAQRVSDLLGEDHDLAVLLEHAQARANRLQPADLELLRRLASKRRRALQREALAESQRLYRRKPGKLARALV
jgi:CHAD domain-containing protein